MRRVLITGVQGQDGQLLAKLLRHHGLDVHGASSGNSITSRNDLYEFHHCDISDYSKIEDLVTRVNPDCVFNLAGVSSVAQSWNDPYATASATGMGAVNVLTACWQHQERMGKAIRVVQASSGEIFGAGRGRLNENSVLNPQSPYAAAKVLAHKTVQAYRDKGLHASNAILFNHESTTRPETFVTRKITRGVARIALGLADKIVLGDLNVSRDWGWAPEYMHALHKMGMAKVPNDYVIATGVSHTLLEFVTAAFSEVGIVDWHSYVEQDKAFMRPNDTKTILADPSRIERELGWHSIKPFHEFIGEMVQFDLKELAGNQ